MGLYFWFVVCCLLSQQGESMRQLFVCRDSQHCPRLQPCQRLSPPTPPATRAPPPTSATAGPSKSLLQCSVYVTTTTKLHFPFLQAFWRQTNLCGQTFETTTSWSLRNTSIIADLQLLRILYCRLCLRHLVNCIFLNTRWVWVPHFYF